MFNQEKTLIFLFHQETKIEVITARSNDLKQDPMI